MVLFLVHLLVHLVLLFLLSNMKKIIMGMLAAASIAAPALADPIKDEEYFTMHSMGCMLLQECTDHVKDCLLYTSPSPRDAHESRMPSSA